MNNSPGQRSMVDRLLFAIQEDDAAATTKEFLEWTGAITDKEDPKHSDALAQLHQLPITTLSEIIRSMDPIRRPELDVNHGINITERRYQWTDMEHVVDNFGIRKHHLQVLEGMRAILNERHTGPLEEHLTIADYEVFLRCAGAASDRYTAKLFWAATRFRSKLFTRRTPRLWTEFLRVRFFTELPYCQFDRGRFRADPRNLINHKMSIDPRYRDIIDDMDNLRYTMSVFKRYYWGRVRDYPFIDESRRIGRRDPKDERSFACAWVRTHTRGYELDEELLCTALMAFTRSRSLDMGLDLILKQHYGIEVDLDTGEISGGYDIERTSPIYPTTKLLQAIVDSCCAMFEIPIGMALLDFVSRKYGVRITHAVWSNLLEWAFENSSKYIHQMLDIFHRTSTTRMERTHPVLEVWGIMTRKEYHITPSFQDIDIYIKTLINIRSFKTADRAIREIGMPYIESLSREFESALFEEILQLNEVATYGLEASTSAATHRRARAEARKTEAHFCAQYWCKILCTEISQKPGVNSRFAVTMIPALVRDYPDCFLPHVEYRTKTAAFNLWRGDADTNNRYSQTRQLTERIVEGQRLSGAVVNRAYDKPRRTNADNEYLYHREFYPPDHPKYVEGENRCLITKNPEFKWPRKPNLTVRERVHRPLRRIVSWRAPLPVFDGHRQDDSFKSSLERQLIL